MKIIIAKMDFTKNERKSIICYIENQTTYNRLLIKIRWFLDFANGELSKNYLSYCDQQAIVDG